jgi:hypothetical protein
MMRARLAGDGWSGLIGLRSRFRAAFQVGSAWLEDSREDDADGQPLRGVNFKMGQVVDRDFVERRDESFYLVGSRAPFASIVREFQDGESPEAIRSAFRTLTLEPGLRRAHFLPGTQGRGRRGHRDS